MNILSDRINTLSESETLAMARRSRELSAKGVDVINLSIGQPDFNTPDFIKEAGKSAIDENYTTYTPVAGFDELREKVAQKLARDNNLNYTASQVVVSTGAKQALANAIMSLVNPGDEVIVPTPYWVSYRELIKLAEGKAVYIPTKIENDFKITPDELEASITDKTKMFLFNSPNNPSGTIYTKEELSALADVFAKYPNIFIISDEIYELINFEGKHESIAQFDTIKDRVVIINGVSKAFAMTGWRLGYSVSNLEIATACNKYQGQITSGTCAISQRAAIKALEADPFTLKESKEMLASFHKRRDILIDGLNGIEGFKTNVPPGAFYVFPEISALFGKKYNGKVIKDSIDFCDLVLDVAHVAIVPGSAFGDANCVRFSYAASEKNILEAVLRIKNLTEKFE
ncbi:MAG: pyridoxal phosphate-dependent aminotransferase [Bacteroidota bacterium]|nr:pyridoxal phosphate-dependent aminotransferase [Bacteroidota bacterium]